MPPINSRSLLEISWDLNDVIASADSSGHRPHILQAVQQLLSELELANFRADVCAQLQVLARRYYRNPSLKGADADDTWQLMFAHATQLRMDARRARAVRASRRSAA